MTKEEEQKAIIKALETPQQYSIDGETVTQRSAKDTLELIKAIKRTGLTTKNAFKALGVCKISTAGTNEK